MKRILLVDANYVCSRAFFATGHLEFQGRGTGMALGAIETVELCQERFGTNLTVLAFDSGKNKRREIYPAYKANRRENKTEEEIMIKRRYLKQIRIMPKIFRRMGYRNILSQRGYEADDLIASVVRDEEGGKIVIVSADQDLWQLLWDNVICYDPRAKKTTSRKSFLDEWGVVPEMWPHVKALAGDMVDNVPGLKGVGLKTAAKYYVGALKSGSAAERTIEAGLAIHNRNLQLIRLPLEGTASFDLVPDEVTAERRSFVMKKLGAAEKRWKR